MADEDICINLNYVSIDNKYSEIRMRKNKYVIRDLSGDEIKLYWVSERVFGLFDAF